MKKLLLLIILLLLPNTKVYATNNLPSCDLNNNGKVDVFDYNEVISHFGALYDIFDYNFLIENFGLSQSSLNLSNITDLSAYKEYSPPTFFIPKNVVNVTILDDGTYLGTMGITQFRGTNFMNDVLQPALDHLDSLGGGFVRLSSGTFYLVGPSLRRQATGQNLEIEMKSNTAIVGETLSDGAPATIISIDSALGNVFSSRGGKSIVVANLRINANHLGNYVVSNSGVTNLLVRNVWIYYPSRTGFGHISGKDNWYVDDRVYSDHIATGGHGFAIGGNQILNLGYQQDSGTTVIHAFVDGYAYNTTVYGGEAMMIRCVKDSLGRSFSGSDPSKPNLNVRIIDSEFMGSHVGIYLCDSPNILMKNNYLHDNVENITVDVYPVL